jgi:subtilisin family serine protease
VTAVDANDHLSSVTNYGQTVQIAAPAVNINGLVPGGGYARDVAGTKGFTSFATPHVTAAAALYWSLHPTYSFAQVRAALLNSADKVPGLNVQNGNRLNSGNLLKNY